MTGNRGRGGLCALAAACVLVAAALFPAAGAASNLSKTATTVTYAAAAGEVNRITVTQVGGNFVFTDAPGVVVAAVAPCTAVANVGTCPTVTGAIGVTSDNQDDQITVAASVAAPTQINLTGGAGSDQITGSPIIRNELSGDGGAPEGADNITGGAENDSIDPGGGNDVASGGGGNDTFDGDDGADVLNGGDGADSFFADSTPDGADQINGGPEIDTYDPTNRTAALTISLDGVANDGEGCPGPTCENDNVGTDVENVNGGYGPNTLTGNASANVLRGSVAADTLSGGDGADTVDGSLGADTVNGDGGNDFVIGGLGGDSVNGGAGDDILAGEFDDEGADTVSGGPGIDEYGLNSGGGGIFDLVAPPVQIDLDGVADDGFTDPNIGGPVDNAMPDIENLVGGQGDDVLVGSKAANVLEGMGGADKLVGASGSDDLIGGRGNDNLNGGKGRDGFQGNGGADVIKSRDRKPDDVACGSAVDQVKADRSDRIAADCDKVKKPKKKGRHHR